MSTKVLYLKQLLQYDIKNSNNMSDHRILNLNLKKRKLIKNFILSKSYCQQNYYYKEI